MASAIKNERVRELIKQAAAKFLEKEGNGTSLVTVTDVELMEKGKKAEIFFTVFPDKMEQEALEFAKRKRSDFRQYLKETAKMIHLPFVDFAIDFGEKNRQKIDSLSRT